MQHANISSLFCGFLVVYLSRYACASPALREKRIAAQEEDIEGCFSEFNAAVTKILGNDNSNYNCQVYCRDQGFVLAATFNGGQCNCGNTYPSGKKVADSNCLNKCAPWSPCSRLRTCCGGVASYIVSAVGDLDVRLQILRRIAKAWQRNNGFRRNHLGSIRTRVCRKTFPGVNDKSFLCDVAISNPVIRIYIKNLQGKSEECTMEALDFSPKTNTFECKLSKNPANMILKAKEFRQEDVTPLDLSQGKPVGIQAHCESSSFKRTCSRTRQISIRKGTSYKVGSGFSVGAEVGFSVTNKVGAEAGAFGVKVSTEVSATFSAAVNTQFSQSSERSSYTDTWVRDSISVSVDVPAHKSVDILFLRKKRDVIYKWKGVFEVYGPFELQFREDDNSKWQFGVTQLVQESDLELYTFGTFKFPNLDTLYVKVVGRDLGSKCGQATSSTSTKPVGMECGN